MAMDFDEMANGIHDARATLARADKVSGQLVRLMRGRLRTSGASASDLADLKRELKDFNAHTGRWK